MFFVPITCWEQGKNTTNPMPHSSSGDSHWAAWGLAGEGGPGEGGGRASGGDEVKVIDAAQPAVGEAGDASVSTGAGRGVNERWRHACSSQSAHPGWLQLMDLWPPPPQNRSVTFQKVEPLCWCQAGWEAGLGVGRGAEWSVPGRGKHSQPVRQTPAKVTQKVATVRRSAGRPSCVVGARGRRVGV